MPGKTFGGSPTKPNNTRDYTADYAPGATSGPGPSSGKSVGKGDAKYHLQGRPVTRKGGEIDQR